MAHSWKQMETMHQKGAGQWNKRSQHLSVARSDSGVEIAT
jgi:hypothetical protein